MFPILDILFVSSYLHTCILVVHDLGTPCGNELTVSGVLYFLDHIYNNSTADIRLVNGTSPYDGRIEIRTNSSWGIVCSNNGFGATEAIVACRMLGIEYVNLNNYAFRNINCTFLT